jgi:hypothetical protein
MSPQGEKSYKVITDAWYHLIKLFGISFSMHIKYRIWAALHSIVARICVTFQLYDSRESSENSCISYPTKLHKSMNIWSAPTVKKG